MTLKINPKTVLIKLLMVIIVLLFANIASILARNYFDINPYRLYDPYKTDANLLQLFFFDSESNIPTFYSSFLLMGCSVLLINITIFHRQRKSPYLLWFGLAVIFLFLSMDEIVLFHERLAIFVLKEDLPLFLKSAWVAPYFLALLLFLAIYSKFILALNSRSRFLFVISGVIYISGAAGFELLGAILAGPMYWNIGSTVYVVTMTCEEFLEMLGASLFIYSLLDYISVHAGSLTFTFLPDNGG